jgi:hypothetical protein
MKKPPLKARLQYKFDNYMSRGTPSLIGLLFVIMLALVLIVGGIAFFFNDGKSLLHTLWMSLNHTLDPGTLADVEGSPFYIFAMFLMTLCGILLTSVLIGIINAGFEQKMESLRHGRSTVIEHGHTVILGFNETTFTILEELILANENHKNCVIVVLDETDKQDMEEQLRDRITDRKTTRIICRSGKPDSVADLQMCSLAASARVIVALDNDALVTQTVLAAAHMLREAGNEEAHIVCLIENPQYKEPLLLAGHEKLEVLSKKEFTVRMMAHAARQPGISAVFEEFLDFDGDEIYIEHIPGLAGKRFEDLGPLFRCSSVLGISKQRAPKLNPPKDYVLSPSDELILLASDDCVSCPDAVPQAADKDVFAPENTICPAPQHILVFGHSEVLDEFLQEQDAYLSPGSKVTIGAGRHIDAKGLPKLRNITVETVYINLLIPSAVGTLLSTKPDSIVLLAGHEVSPETADAETLLLLALIEKYCTQTGVHFAVISELRLAEHRALAKATVVTDFIISSNLTALLLSQISQERQLAAVFRDLLDEDGSELYLKPAAHYIKLHKPVKLYTVAAAVAAKSEVFIGIRRKTAISEKFDIRLNLPKDTVETFGEEDMLIVLAED